MPAAHVSGWPFNWPISAHVLGPPLPGQGPAPRGLELGDVILTSPVQPNALQQTIFHAQTLVFVNVAAAFTHAALYVGNGTIIDSTPMHGISARGFVDLTHGSFVQVRRYKGIGPATQWDICNAALGMQGKYSAVSAVADYLIQLANPPHNWSIALQRLVGDRSAAYCGQFIASAYLQGAYLPVVDKKNRVPLPGGLSESGLLETVPIAW